MKELISELFTNFGQKIAMFILVGTTAVTTGTAVSRVVLRSDTPSEIVETEKTVENIEEDRVTTEKLENTTKDKIIVATPNPTSVPKAIASPTKVAVDTSNRCLVTLFGKQYDVTSLRSSHGGGDIFNCGTDMTSAYQGEHGNNLSRMASYLYDPANPTTVAPNSQSNKNRDNDEEDEIEDKRNEDRYEDKDEDDD